MPENIKKRSASHIYYGINQDTGECLHISQVQSGIKCNCKCFLCGGSFEARKGTRRRHHFAHVSNYDCMYAGEVSVYLGFCAVLRRQKQICLPAITLRFPTWNSSETLRSGHSITIDDVSYECQKSQYPPLLQIAVGKSRLRILLNFDHYYDSADKGVLTEEAKKGNYSILMYSLPAIDKEDFSPEKIAHMAEDCSQADWVFSQLEKQKREQYYANAKTPEKKENGYLCPISINGEYTAYRGNCAQCEYNIGKNSHCLCTAVEGIRHIDDFKKSDEERQQSIKAIRLKNEADQKQRRRDLEANKARTFSSVSIQPNALLPSKPTDEELEQEYRRIQQVFDPDAKAKTVDKYGRRWIQCEICGKIKEEKEFAVRGGSEYGENRGACSVCLNKGSAS